MLEKGILDWKAIQDAIRKIGEIKLKEELRKKNMTIEDLVKQIGEEKTKIEIMEAGRREIAKTNVQILLLPYTPGGYGVGARPFTRPVVIRGEKVEKEIPRSEILKEIEKAREEIIKERERIIKEEKKVPPEEFGKPRKMGERRGPIPPYE
jgi:transcriptional regulator with XRE-family HTH domain